MFSIKDYWIEELQKIREFRLISDIEDNEFSLLNKALNELIDNQFIQTAKEKGIARREKLLKIQPFNDDTLETRRFRALNRWNEQLPYTYRILLKKLDQLCGKDGYTIKLNNNEYTLKIRIELTKKRMFDEVKLMTRRICPANLLVDVALRYNQHCTLSKYTHAQLSTYTHVQLRNEVLN